MIKKNIVFQLTVAILFTTIAVKAQTITPNLPDSNKWKLINRSAEVVNEDGKKAIRLSEAPGDGMMILKDFEFADGIIELDIKGKNVLQQSFVGVAFHGQNDDSYDAVYFRPFNFANPDTARRSRAVQYVSMPNFPWEKLRQDFPGRYENKVNPVPNPDGWFHAKIVVSGKQVKVFVDNAEKPCLEVEKLTDTKKGGFGLWVGNNSGAAFANLKITPAAESKASAAVIPYGNNSETGKFLRIKIAYLTAL